MPDLSPLPADFVWGVATSAFQIEGAADADGRGPSIWDDFCRVPDAIDGGDDGLVATDSYHRWPEDLELLQELGVDSYRFSVAWPRVQPDGGPTVNAAGLDHYDRLVDDLLAAGIDPLVTLYHWDLPSVLQHRGGWVARETALRFADYTDVVARRLGDRVHRWVTLNEPLCTAWIGHLEGRMAPGVRDLRSAVHASYHQLLGHGLATQALRANDPGASVGIVLNLSPIEPASGSEADRLAAERADGHTNRWWLDPVHGRGFPADVVEIYGVPLPSEDGDDAVLATPLDFLGVNYYFRQVVAADDAVATLRFRQVPVEGAPTTAMGWEVHPQGLADVLLRVTKDYATPQLWVTENGAAFDDVPDAEGYVADAERTAFVLDHVQAVSDAVAQGAPVQGFYAWSLLDNFEWSYGYWPRFGLARVDYETQRRTVKQSGRAYADLVAGHRANRPTT
ncbi:GH1 family beta-glucosidase [Angustibacter aerolatus]